MKYTSLIFLVIVFFQGFIRACAGAGEDAYHVNEDGLWYVYEDSCSGQPEESIFIDGVDPLEATYFGYRKVNSDRIGAPMFMSYEGKTWCNGVALDGVNQGNMEFVKFPRDGSGIYARASAFFTDGTSLYHNCNKIEGADVDSFGPHPSDDYFVDKDSVFTLTSLSGSLFMNELPGVNPDDFRFFPGTEYGYVDKNGEKITKNRKQDYYLYDGNAIYVDGEILEGSDADSFEYLQEHNGFHIAKDADSVFFNDEIQDIDPADFVSVGNGYFTVGGELIYLKYTEDTDENGHRYTMVTQIKVSGVNPDGFEVMEWYEASGEDVYYIGEYVPGITASELEGKEFREIFDMLQVARENAGLIEKQGSFFDGDIGLLGILGSRDEEMDIQEKLALDTLRETSVMITTDKEGNRVGYTAEEALLDAYEHILRTHFYLKRYGDELYELEAVQVAGGLYGIKSNLIRNMNQWIDTPKGESILQKSDIDRLINGWDNELILSVENNELLFSTCDPIGTMPDGLLIQDEADGGYLKDLVCLYPEFAQNENEIQDLVTYVQDPKRYYIEYGEIRKIPEEYINQGNYRELADLNAYFGKPLLDEEYLKKQYTISDEFESSKSRYEEEVLEINSDSNSESLVALDFAAVKEPLDRIESVRAQMNGVSDTLEIVDSPKETISLPQFLPQTGADLS